MLPWFGDMSVLSDREGSGGGVKESIGYRAAVFGANKLLYVIHQAERSF